MNKVFRKYDKLSTRIIRIKTAELNDILKTTNAKVEVVDFKTELQHRYEAYCANCKVEKTPPESIDAFYRKYGMPSCSFVTYENIPSRVLISQTLEIDLIDVRYAKNIDGVIQEGMLEITYSV